MSAGVSLEVSRPAPVAVPPGRVPPQNLDAERSVLGGVLLDNTALNDVLELLKPEDFYRDAHRKVFEAMCALSSRNEPIDRVTLKDELTALGAYEAVGGGTSSICSTSWFPARRTSPTTRASCTRRRSRAG